jgi:hypothetical protein
VVGVVSVSSAPMISSAVCGRSAARFSRHFITMRPRRGGMPGRREVMGVGRATMWAPRMAWAELPVNGGSPVRIS